MNFTQAIKSPNVRAFLWMLRYGEGTQGPNGYRMHFGGELFESFADHPRRVIHKNGYSSSAAGAYQILEKTWNWLVEKYGFSNFEPATQDIAAIALIAHRGALSDVITGNLESAIYKCNREWASLPGSPYGQPVVTMQDCKREYLKAGGEFVEQLTQDSVMPIPPVEQIPESDKIIEEPLPKGEKMPLPLNILAAMLPSLVQLVPQLGKILGSGSDNQVRNIEAANAVLDVATKAIGATNEQEMVERIQSNPEDATKVKEAIEKEWFGLTEVGGGIEAARKQNIVLAGGTVTTNDDGSTVITTRDGYVPIYQQPAFVLSMFLLVPVYFVVFIVLQPWWGDVNYFSDEVKLVVVTAIVTGVLGSLTGFWLGSSFGSQKKDDDKSDTINKLIAR